MEGRKRRSEGSRQPGRKKAWERPEWGRFKINVDAAFNQKTQAAAIGIVGRDWEGRYIGGISRSTSAESAFQAECQAMIAAMEGRSMWGNKVTVETDCEELYRRMEKEKLEGCEWRSIEVMQECLRLLKEVRSAGWQVSLVARQGNRAADFLATGALRGVVPQGWLPKPPPSLGQIMKDDSEEAPQLTQGRIGIG